MQQHQFVSRRSVAKGAAWAVPAVAVAATAPTLAASTTCTDELQMLTQTFDTLLSSWGVWEPMPATVTMSMQLPTCVQPGDVFVPTLTATLTTSEFDERYSGRGLTGDFEFFYNLTGAVIDPRGHRVRFTELSLYRDAGGDLGLRVSGAGQSHVVADAGDLITVASNPLALDTYFGDYEHDFYATDNSGTAPLGTITVASG